MAVEISGDSPQAVAYRLMELIGVNEKKALGTPGSSADKKWILDTYKECLHSVLDIQRWGSFGS